MFNILISTDINHDPAIEDRYIRVLRSAGFTTNVCQPLSQTINRIEIVAQSEGKIDAVVLAHHGSMTSSVMDPLKVARSIRGMGEKLAFLGAVRAAAVPIIAVTQEGAFGPSADIKWFEILDSATFDRHPEALAAEVIATISGWRQSLIQELDYVGYAVTLNAQGDLDVSHALVRRRLETEILTEESTPGSLRAGQYLILAQDMLQEFAPYRKLQYLLNNYRQLASAQGCKPETIFQRFFEDHPHLIRRDLFDAHWAQPSLRISEDSEEALRPDFVLRPRGAAAVGTKWQILDLKLPDDPLVVSQRFHASLSSKLTRAIQQLQNYRDYFNRPEAGEELKRHFGFRPLNPRLAVLIGRRDRLNDPSIMDKAQGPRYLDIEILTYDDIAIMEANRLATHSALARVF